MKKNNLIYIIVFISCSIMIVLLYNYSKNKYYKYLYEITGDILNINIDEITQFNYKQLTYEREILHPGGRVNGALVYEKIYFRNDSIAVVETITDPTDNTFLLRRLFGIKGGKKEINEYVLSHDTLFARETLIQGNLKVTPYYTFFYSDKSLHIGFLKMKSSSLE